LKQRATFYYRLLKTDISLAWKVANGDHQKITEFLEDRNDEIKERLFLEFNSLSVVYQKPSERYLKENILKQTQASEKKYYSERWTKKVAARSTIIHDDEEQDGSDEKKTQEIKTQATPTPVVHTSLDDLLDFGGSANGGSTQTTMNTQPTADFLGDLLGGGPSTSQPTAVNTA